MTLICYQSVCLDASYYSREIKNCKDTVPFQKFKYCYISFKYDASILYCYIENSHNDLNAYIHLYNSSVFYNSCFWCVEQVSLEQSV